MVVGTWVPNDAEGKPDFSQARPVNITVSAVDAPLANDPPIDPPIEPRTPFEQPPNRPLGVFYAPVEPQEPTVYNERPDLPDEAAEKAQERHDFHRPKLNATRPKLRPQ